MLKKNYPTFTVAALMLVFTLTTVQAQDADRAYRVDSFATSVSPFVHINTSGGSIQVTGHNRNEVEVMMFVRRGNRYYTSSDTDLSDFDIIIEQDGDKITASARRKEGITRGFWGSGNHPSISFRVLVPINSVVDGRTSGGSVTAENIFNDVNLRTSGGSVTGTRLQGNIDLRTSGGSITLENITGALNARTSGGSIRANNLTGDADLRTSGGSIRLENITARLAARTSGGSIRAHLSEFTDDAELRTSGGSIRVEIPRTEHFDLDLSGGRVQTELRNFSGSSSRNRISGRIGNGGPSISARTSAGTVELRYY